MPSVVDLEQLLPALRTLAALQAARTDALSPQGIGLRPQPWAGVSRPVGPVGRFSDRLLGYFVTGPKEVVSKADRPGLKTRAQGKRNRGPGGTTVGSPGFQSRAPSESPTPSLETPEMGRRQADRGMNRAL